MTIPLLISPKDFELKININCFRAPLQILRDRCSMNRRDDAIQKLIRI